MTETALTRRAIMAQAWPIMLGQASVPLVGIIDTIVVGRTGDPLALAGVALGATIINLVFWSFGFLRMGLTGLTAQADGAGEGREVEALLLRGVAIGAALGLVLLALQVPITMLALSVMSGGTGISAEADAYVSARFFGAPAALAVFAITGWLLGLGRTRSALVLQIVMNACNAGLDVALVWGAGLGAGGIGAGTAGAEWIALVTGIALCWRINGAGPLALLRRIPIQHLLDGAALRKLFAVNRDLMIRTIALLLVFTWLASSGARLGATTLAANHVLLQFISVAAFVLDAFAFTAEARVGAAIGAGSYSRFIRAIRLTSEFALAGGALIALAYWLLGASIIDAMITDDATYKAAVVFLPFTALVPFIGAPSWMLDGVFIGATRGKALRNAAVVTTGVYIALDLALRPYGNWGVWIAFTATYLLRAVTLGAYLPSLIRQIRANEPLAKRATRA
ncbi:MATE family efflux transporter [Croceicoccus mobilis]|uniref:MATE family efflux transporter n=1 Tax=Croceicoccus mobilis TaxID=1703339 RepID=A0A916Z9W8_9SPHN|nr:MATE family efflux transporter [Croceicoccus mobilis]GGD83595.1 MATE family efflux transporter [Croceicoccus mobilis]